MQYLEVTTTPSIVSLKDYEEKVVPKLTDLHEVYGIAAPICMLIIRPIVQAAILVRLPSHLLSPRHSRRSHFISIHFLRRT